MAYCLECGDGDCISKCKRLRAELATLREQHSNVLREHEGQRQDNAAKDAHIAKLEALVADQKAATDEEFQNCSKIEAELAEANARIAGLEAVRPTSPLDVATERLFPGAVASMRLVQERDEADARAEARIAGLEAYHTNCTDYINGLLGNMADDDKERVAILARAERAEAQLLAERSTAAYKDVRIERAEAERDAMRDKLRWALHELREHQADYHHITPPGDIDKASAALAPPPADEK